MLEFAFDKKHSASWTGVSWFKCWVGNIIDHGETVAMEANEFFRFLVNNEKAIKIVAFLHILTQKIEYTHFNRLMQTNEHKSQDNIHTHTHEPRNSNITECNFMLNHFSFALRLEWLS